MLFKRICILLLSAFLQSQFVDAKEEDMGGRPAAKPKAEIRRVVVIHIETTRRDAMSCYGGIAKTPNIDRVAASGMVFTNAIVPVSKTAPSSASFLTGRLAWRNGVFKNGFALPHRYVTLAELLNESGFLTAAFIHNRVLLNLPNGKRTGFDQGFDVFEWGGDVPIEVPDGGHFNAAVRKDAEILTGALIRFLREHEDERLFLWTFYFDPHAPYGPPAPYDSMYLNHDELLKNSVVIPEDVLQKTLTYVPGRTRSHEYIARYYGSITYTDVWIGKFLDVLEDLPGKSLLVITGDHGEGLGEFNYWFEHGDSLKWPAVNVPMIIACPGVIPAGTSDALAANIDIAPTILEVLGIPSDPLDPDGRSLLPVMSDDSLWDDRMIPIQTYRGDAFRGVRTRDFSLHCLYSPKDDKMKWSELFDLRSDPKETVNVAEGFPEEHEELLQFLEEYFATETEVTREINPRKDPEMVKRLRSLGYLR
jgi:arylsulfatase A-like enzyme